MMKFNRQLVPPKASFFLFGPRATGKSTWLRDQVQPNLTIDLLRSSDFLRFSNHPEELRANVEGSRPKRVVIDEIQKVPSLLDEVHSLLFDFEEQVQFILTGSSARKLKRSRANLLAGRALVRRFHPLTGSEIGDNFGIEKALRFGLLPKVWNLETEAEKRDYLYSYVETYLREEIQQEASVRNLPSYTAFLEHFALRNAQVINLQNVSQETGIARTTLNGYLDILEQTLLGIRLAPIKLKAKIKEVATPKFYFFDPGVVRGLSLTLDEDLGSQKGYLLETYVLHELQSHADYSGERLSFHYWATPSDNEVDFIVSKGKSVVGIEVKSSQRWDLDFNRGLNTLLEGGKIKKAFGVYLGNEKQKKGKVTVLPAHTFSQFLYKGGLFNE